MSLQTFYLGGLNPNNWHEIFVFCLKHADTFNIRFCNKEENESFHAFFSLPGISVANWVGMQDGIEIRGPLTEEVRDLFYQLQEPAFRGKQPKVWDFKLFSQGREVLSIDDFTNRLIHLTQGELGFLTSQKIDFSNWEAVAMAIGENESEAQVELNEEELREIAGLISHWLAGDKKH